MEWEVGSMSEVGTLKCPSCGQMTEAEGFCKFCGAPLKPAPTVKPSVAPPMPPITGPQAPPVAVEAARPQAEPTAPPSLLLPRKPVASVVVIKTLISPSAAREIAEKAKLSLSPQVKRGLFGPRPEELIQVQSVDKGYENFVRCRGVYSIRYLKSNAYSNRVDENVVEVLCGNASFKPVDRVVKIEVDERKLYRREATILYDKDGDELKIEVIPQVEVEGQPSSILSEAKIDVKRFGRLEETVFSMATNVLRLRICDVPDEVGRIEEERMDIPEFAHVFVPVYRATVRHVKTNETMALRIDGVTGKAQAVT